MSLRVLPPRSWPRLCPRSLAERPLQTFGGRPHKGVVPLDPRRNSLAWPLLYRPACSAICVKRGS
jgi:hypothetical protein